MRITYIELVSYERFAVSGIRRFAMTITQSLQLILGTNGGGKSSLLEELTPLPANRDDYLSDGSKLIRIEHRGKHYELKSTFSPSQKHSFLCDEVELNDGGTVTVQKELVLQHFGIDEAVHGLIIGRDKSVFTQQRPAERKSWFLRLSDADYDYALLVYNKLKKEHSYTIGAIREAKRKLVEESNKLIESAEEELLTQEAHHLHELISALLEQRKPVEDDPHALELEQREIGEDMGNQARSMQRLMKGWVHPERTRESIAEQLVSRQSEYDTLQGQLRTYTSLFGSNQRKIDALQKAEAQTVDSLTADVAELQAKIDHAVAARMVAIPAGQSGRIHDAYYTVRTQALEILNAIPNNQDRRYAQARYTQVKEELAKLTLKRTQLQEQARQLQTAIGHMQEHHNKPDVACPKCDHRFSLHYNEAKHQAMTMQLAALTAQIENDLDKQIATLQEYCDRFVEYVGQYRQWTNLINHWPVLAPYWGWLTEQNVILDHPEMGLAYLQKIETDLSLQVQWDAAQEVIEDKQKLIASLRDVGGADLQNLLAQNQELETKIADGTQVVMKAGNEITRLKEALSRFDQIHQHKASLMSLLTQSKQLLDKQIESARRTHYNQAIRTIQSMLGQLEHRLSQQAMQKAVVASLEAQITKLNTDEQALSILVKQLSPTEGLIAEGLVGFIHHFVFQMNQFIRKVWSYDLQVMAPKIVEGQSLDLDYYFPMKVPGKQKPIPDIDRGSAGMKEIINLGYRIMAMKSLGLQDAPLVLDEFGKAFDETHRFQATQMIKSLIEQHSFSQVFMVSHYESSYGALSNAEICVLNPMNITTPQLAGGVNQHVQIN